MTVANLCREAVVKIYSTVRIHTSNTVQYTVQPVNFVAPVKFVTCILCAFYDNIKEVLYCPVTA